MQLSRQPVEREKRSDERNSSADGRARGGVHRTRRRTSAWCSQQAWDPDSDPSRGNQCDGQSVPRCGSPKAGRTAEARGRQLPRRVSPIPSNGEHLLQHPENPPHRRRRQRAERASNTLLVHGPKLIENHESPPSPKSAGDAEGIGMPFRRERGHDERPEMVVEIVRRNDDAGPGLADLSATCRIEVDRENLPPADRGRSYHAHSFWSKRVAVGSSRSRSASRSRSR